MIKKFILSILMFPAVASAQKFELSLFGGVAYTNLHKLKALTAGRYSSGELSMTGSAQAAFRFGKTSLGVKADIFSIKSKSQVYTYGTSSQRGYYVDYIYRPYSPAVNLSLFVNQNFKVRDYFLYAGIQAGYAISSKSTYRYGPHPDDTFLPDFPGSPNGKSDGATFGVQVGCGRNLNNHFTVKFESAPRYLYSFNVSGEKDDQNNFNTFIIPVSVGLSYKF